MWPIDRPAHWVGRTQELTVLRAGAEALRRGEGAVVWVEGEPGIGKSSLVAEALAEAGDPEWDIGWGMADQLAEQLPLRSMLDCLQVRPGSPDPRRAHAAELLGNQRLGLFAGGDAAAGIEILVTLADELCVAAPTVLVLDDLQWADHASLIVWHQLAAAIDQLRLLLIATCRPAPPRLEVQQLRAAVARRGGAVITLGPLAEPDVAALVTTMLGTPPSDALRQLTAQAAGNPLYLRELVDALVRERAVRNGPATEVSVMWDQLPASLAAVLNDRLSSVSAETAQMLRTAALLGGRFTVADLAVLLRQPAWDLAPGLQEATTAGVLAGSGADLAFRHPLIRQALYESMPAALRTARHAEAARELAAAGADALTIAQQLSAGGRPGQGWARAWLVKAAPALTVQAPQLAAGLLRQELDETPSDDEAWDGLAASLVRALLAAGSYDEVVQRARAALALMTDPVRRAETYSVLTRALTSAGDNNAAIATVRQAIASSDLSRTWHARMLAMLPMYEHTNAAELDSLDAIARRALAIAEEAGDAFATANALTDLWLTRSVRRDHAAALEHIDRALHVLGEDPGYADLRSFDVDARIFTLQNLDRWPDAELAVRLERQSAPRRGSPDRTTWTTGAVLRYWLGQWDDALAELNPDEDDDAPGLTHTFLREGWLGLLVHGVTALIAGRRDQRAIAGQALRRGLAVPIVNNSDRENQDFLVAAHALALEQRGETRQAMLVLAGILPRRDGEMTLVHQWLPDLVRLALAAGDPQVAQGAVQACQDEAAAETPPARAAAASLRCRGLLRSDPGPLREAVAHYRSPGPAVDLPAALEDLAAVLAKRSRPDEARAALNEAVSLYENLEARWDIRRAGSRLRAYGIRRGARGPRGPRATAGWESLTPTELKIAALVATGSSTSDIARDMFLSRRTVQTYISRILAKLGVKGRAEIVREAVRHGISP